MYQRWKTAVLCLLLCMACTVGAQAMENHMLKVGIKFGDEAMFSANLQNYDGAGLGYAFGYFDGARSFVPLGAATQENKITVVIDDNVFISGGSYYQDMSVNYAEYIGAYHLQLARRFDSYEEAASAAASYNGAFVAYLSDRYAVRVGQYRTSEGVQRALNEWTGESAEIVSPSRTGVMVTATGTDRILFYFDCGGLRSLGVQPQSSAGEKTVTWFRGYRYYGGFEYQRVTGGNLSVINVVNIEDYTKGSVPYEIGNDKPLEAIKAQAVCARTYAAMQTRHRSQGFDVCTTDDCQVYQGVAASNAITDRAVDETADVYMYYNGNYAQAFYYSSNGGASEDAKNVWNDEVPYCIGKVDPYEAQVSSRINKYSWTTTYSKSELTSRLRARGIEIGTVTNAYVSEYTPTGNVYAVTFVGTSGTKTVYRESCRTTLGLRSMRFTINGGTASGGASSYYINDAGGVVSALRGLYTIAGGGTVSQYSAAETDAYVASANGTARLQAGNTATTAPAAPSDMFTITGSGWGHNVGMSQWGAVAMAEQGFSYREILEFYYTGIEIR